MKNLKTTYEELNAIDLIMKGNYFSTKEKYENSTKYEYNNFCSCCGRGIKGYPKHALLTLGGPMPIPFNTDLDSIDQNKLEIQGYFPIGSECKKMYPKEYVGVAPKEYFEE